MYSLCNDYKLRNGGYRKTVIKNYLILYRINKEDETVYVVRVVYGGRNYSELIWGREFGVSEVSMGRGFDNNFTPFERLPCLLPSTFRSGAPLTPSHLSASNSCPSF